MGSRLDAWLAADYPDVSRSTWQKYVKLGYVSVNGQVVKEPNQKISPADKISFELPTKSDFSERQLPILYEDENVLVIDKPEGVLTHAKGAVSSEFTFSDFLSRFQATPDPSNNKVGVVHRLDRDTSGVIIGSKNEETRKYLQKQFANRTVKKTYLAVVDGMPKSSKAVIDLPIGRNPSKPSTFRVDSKGKAALTTYEVIATNPQGLSLVKLAPQTGRTHQLRVHMAYLNTPIHGDRIYGTPADRMYLHADSLEITLLSKERKVFKSQTPPEFLKLFPGVKL